MRTEIVVAIISACVALPSAGFTLWGQARTARLAAEFESFRVAEQRRFEAERTVAHYREPLARAAYDLQSRLYNILQQNLLGVYFDNGNEREREYVVDNTTFLVAQYFAWTEIVRRDIQYIDLGSDEQTRQLARLQDDIYSLFQTDRFPPLFRVFAGEQRAIGERMIRESARGLDCIGYATFLDQAAKRNDRLIGSIQSDVRSMSSHLPSARPRLVALQHALIDLLMFLDPDFVRFSRERRTKVPEVR
jgi:hypothetical protein